MKLSIYVIVFVWNVVLILLVGNAYNKSQERCKQVEYQLASLQAAFITSVYIQKNNDSLSSAEKSGLWSYMDSIFPVTK